MTDKNAPVIEVYRSDGRGGRHGHRGPTTLKIRWPLSGGYAKAESGAPWLYLDQIDGEMKVAAENEQRLYDAIVGRRR